jgi:uncharacterized Zn-binding protein involved in type VI secretion
LGSPAARLGDATVHGGMIVAGFPTVRIGGQLASRIGDMHLCPQVTVIVPHIGGPLVLGSFTVLTGGVPQSRVGDMLICVGPPDAVAMGCPTVFVGMSGGGLGFGAILSGLMAGLGNFAGGLVASIEDVVFPPSPRPPLTQLLHARELAVLANDVYESNSASYKPPAGWTRISDNPSKLPFRLRDFPFHDPDSDFCAALYRNNETGEIVIAYRGTNSLKGWEADFKQASGKETPQYNHASNLARLVQQSYPNENVELTGHSLGGGLAEVGSAVTGYQATTFNAARVNPNTFTLYHTVASDVNGTNYIVQGEPVSTVQNALPFPGAGEQVVLEARDSNGNILNPASSHGMDSVQESLDYSIGQEKQ